MSARIIVEKLIPCDYALFEKWNSLISGNQQIKCHQIRNLLAIISGDNILEMLNDVLKPVEKEYFDRKPLNV